MAQNITGAVTGAAKRSFATLKSTLPKAAKIAPVFAWASHYQREWLRPDLIAGLTTVAVLIPSALAYAELAGVPPVNGLYAAFIAMLVYAVFGTSRHLSVGPESGSAVLAASVLALAAPPSAEAYLAYAAMLALLVGGLLIAGGFFKLAVVGLATLASWLFDLSARGISVVGEVPSGLPGLRVPLLGPTTILNLSLGALAIATLVFSDATVAARRAAARKNMTRIPTRR